MSAYAAPAAATSASKHVSFYAAVGLAGAGAGATAATIWAVGQSPILVRPEGTAIMRGLLIAAWIAAGVYMWWRRPDNRLGLLVAGAGFFYAGTSLNASGDSVTYTIGRVWLAAFLVYLIYIFLCFPRDRLDAARDRWYIAGFAGVSAVLWAFVVAFAERLPPGGPFAECASKCPDNGFRLVSVSDGFSDALIAAVGAATAAALIGVCIMLVAKARSRYRLRRRAVEPLLYASVVIIGAYITNTFIDSTGATLQALRIAETAGAILIPVAMLAGLAQARTYAAVTMGRLVASVRGERVTQSRMQDLLRDALGDPSLTLALWDRDRSRYLDVEGAVVGMPATAPGRALTRVTNDGRPAAALEYNASLDDAGGVLEGLAETSLVLLENTRLVDELRASRARIVASADRERHRLERDLHDGAQQRLILLQMKIGRVERRIVDATLAGQLEEIRDDAAAALEELRVLAHGIYPTVLRERGLPEALRAFAVDAPIAVRVRDRGIGRCSPTVEAALYFCVLEAIQNAAKHAGAGARLAVELSREGNQIEFSVSDDGRGFGEGVTSDGMGFATMRDRIGAVGGDLEISSVPGAGVTVRASVTEASSVATSRLR